MPRGRRSSSPAATAAARASRAVREDRFHRSSPTTEGPERISTAGTYVIEGWMASGASTEVYRARSATRPGEPHDLELRARLADLLNQVRPFYRRLPASRLPELLEDLLGAPVVLTSHGPTALDKTAQRQARR